MNKKMTVKQTALKAKELSERFDKLEKITEDKMRLFLTDLAETQNFLLHCIGDGIIDSGNTLSQIRLIISFILGQKDIDLLDEVAKRHGLDFNYIGVDKQKRRSTLYFVIKRSS